MLERYVKLRTFVKETFSETTQHAVDTALEYASEKLGDATRYDGSPMLDRGVAVAHIVVSEIGLGRNSAVASIIHDVVRIADKSKDGSLVDLLEDIRRLFGEEVVGIVVGLANISAIKLKASKEQASNFRDLIVSYSEDCLLYTSDAADE